MLRDTPYLSLATPTSYRHRRFALCFASVTAVLLGL
ncbi:hypothetical protein ISN45_At05g027510 [Arabidopsis thaliana x Arabidopsis arenosa]|uniref:Uncharacterized protein n=2 Tax=Arabidopsis TaxID=3701 RepID=A0A8T2DH25_ARASU|nr:hypothetical protein ISN45_At05g027510 [Arabidopsis thaliana x Arabidopsis arenosa]KAG7610719.1 hypothetical protein ISN44_As05g027240 [Arabidopsis suecica]